MTNRISAAVAGAAPALVDGAGDSAYDVLDMATDAIVQIAKDDRVVYVNRAAEALFGWTRREIVGQLVTVLIPESRRAAHDHGFAEYLRTDTSPVVGSLHQGHGLRRDGSTVPIELSVSASRSRSGSVYTAIIRDRAARLAAEAALRFRDAALAAVADPVVITDREGTIVWVNEAFTSTTGYSESEVLGRTPRILKSGLTSPAAYKDLWDTILSGRTWTGELINRRKDGSTFMAELTVSSIKDLAGRPTHFVATLRDITARWKMEESLREAEDLYRTLFEESPDGIVLLDPASGLPVAFNDAACANLGWSREEFEGLRIAEYEAPLDPERTIARHQPDGATPWARFETRLRTKSGELHDVLASVRTLQIQGLPRLHVIYRDITHCKRVEASLRETTEYLEKLFRHASVPILAWDPDFRITRVNQAFEHLVRRSGEELVGKDVRELLASTANAQTRDAIERTALGDNMELVEIPILRSDGSTRAVQWKSASILAEDGTSLLGTVAQGTDVTKQKRLRDQLYHSQKMDSIGRLAGGVAHDFNNVLAVILSYSEMLLSELDPDLPMVKDIQEIRRAADRAAALTRQLLAFSRKQVIAPKVIDINRLIADTQAMLRRLIGEDVELRLELDGKVDRVLVDGGQFEQVIMNLVVNARDAMRGGGTITISTSSVVLADDDTRRRPGLPPGPYIAIAVADTGSGMDPETLAHIFEPFFTTKEAGRGTGLGLSTVYGIVTQSRGHIEVASVPGRERASPSSCRGRSADPASGSRERQPRRSPRSAKPSSWSRMIARYASSPPRSSAGTATRSLKPKAPWRRSTLSRAPGRSIWS